MHIKKNKINDMYSKAINKSIKLNSSIIFAYSQQINSININDLIDHGEEVMENQIYWEQKSKNISFISIGQITSLNTDEIDKNAINIETNSYLKNMMHLNESTQISIPTFIGGQNFNIRKENSNQWSDFPISYYLVPKILIMNNDGYYSITFYYLINPKSARVNIHNKIFETLHEISSPKSSKINNKKTTVSNSSYLLDNQSLLNKINEAQSFINNKDLSKIVISNILSYNVKNINYREILEKLSSNYPNCSIFFYKLKNKGVFFGASPEMILKKEANKILIDALAGTIPSGNTEKEIENNSNFLYQNLKINEEHDIVVMGIKKSLSKIGINSKSSKKEIMKLKNLLHLKTSISAEVKEEVNILDILDEITPTPALSGYSKNKSLEKINELENFDRGWYAGPIGWINSNYESQFYAGLRSAYVNKNKINLFAGAGITLNSNPLEEIKEIDNKLQAINEIINE